MCTYVHINNIYKMYMWYNIIHRKEKNEFLSLRAILAELEITVLNEMRQEFKDQEHIISLLHKTSTAAPREVSSGVVGTETREGLNGIKLAKAHQTQLEKLT